MDEFEWYSYNHVYRELNMIADGLSEEVLELDHFFCKATK
jgi:hypothetical protein